MVLGVRISHMFYAHVDISHLYFMHTLLHKSLLNLVSLQTKKVITKFLIKQPMLNKGEQH